MVSLCLENIDKNIVDVIIVEGFIDIDLDMLVVVLECDILGICEVWLFNVVVCWFEVEC